jgi:hypothetical protein
MSQQTWAQMGATTKIHPEETIWETLDRIHLAPFVTQQVVLMKVY